MGEGPWLVEVRDRNPHRVGRNAELVRNNDPLVSDGGQDGTCLVDAVAHRLEPAVRARKVGHLADVAGDPQWDVLTECPGPERRSEVDGRRNVRAPDQDVAPVPPGGPDGAIGGEVRHGRGYDGVEPFEP